MKTRSVVESGFEGLIAEIECHISNGLPSIIIVGFANRAVDEARERIRSAFASTSLPLPKKRITINLAPADIPKETTAFDLAIAAAILASAESIPAPDTRTLFLGELGLDGHLRPIRGIIGKLLSAQKQGIQTAFIPAGNQQQAQLVPGLTIYPVNNLHALYLHLTGTKQISPLRHSPIKPVNPPAAVLNFSDVVGQKSAKRVLEIAAAGNHNVLLSGPPGTGKSMLAKALPSILPPLTLRQILETSHLHSLSNKNYESLITTPPFRAPHHSTSDTAITGGGQKPRPGEISLAHNGVLFFDELPEFKRTAIEALRQPLEDRKIIVSRAKDTIVFPASFILIATANPCPCGYFGTHRECSCLPASILKYRQKLSGPILDRIDLYTNVENVEHTKLLEEDKSAESSERIRARVLRARQRQYERLGANKCNAQLTNYDIKTRLHLAIEAKQLLNKAAHTLELSPRAYMRTLKVARTIADLEDNPSILPPHVAEALRYRPHLQTDL